MNKEQAVSLIRQVVEQYKGTAEEHRLLAQAISVIANCIKGSEKKEIKKEKTDK